ncbi:hypothetical protein NKR74_14990 [Bacillus sp. 3103sda1]|uniref:hypothetical protein n=1 Tax=Bacillus sp. 3103sda1 TaxID=2953808 RepID=UPI0020A0049D|nr:hypothetical protein [Bacillus sp. 3103sda1]MCP1124595.1 hypothetical protein [Bacillus sp. 3103sda1]
MALVLKKDAEKAKKLNEFLKICDKKQSEALDAHNEKEFYIWVKEARLARRELAAMYRSRERHDEELARDKTHIQGIIRRLRSQGIDASVVERAHYITLCEGMV